MRQNGRVYRDGAGGLWLDPGDGKLVMIDGQALRPLREKWGAVSRERVEERLGRLTELVGPRDLLPPTEKWDLLALLPGRTVEETVDLAIRVACHARGADDARDLLEAVGLRHYKRGTPG